MLSRLIIEVTNPSPSCVALPRAAVAPRAGNPAAPPSQTPTQPTHPPRILVSPQIGYYQQVLMTPGGLGRIGGEGSLEGLGRGGIDRVLQLAPGTERLLLAGEPCKETSGRLFSSGYRSPACLLACLPAWRAAAMPAEHTPCARHWPLKTGTPACNRSQCTLAHATEPIPSAGSGPALGSDTLANAPLPSPLPPPPIHTLRAFCRLRPGPGRGRTGHPPPTLPTPTPPIAGSGPALGADTLINTAHPSGCS